MLGFLFGFNARLGRLHYFLGTIALAIGMTGICFAVAASLFQGTPDRTQLMIAMGSRPVIAAIVLFAVFTFILQSMRLRDIGWDPVCVIPCWIALLMIDHLVADKIPAWSLGQEHYGTAIGALVNLVLWLALTFWPGGAENDGAAPAVFGPPRRTFGDKARPANTSSVAAARIARASEGHVVRWTA
jgi:uncharacterized membrane protein YhaH (DUF805 family)